MYIKDRGTGDYGMQLIYRFNKKIKDY